VGHLADTLDTDLSGLKIAVDCSHGSASATAGLLFKKLGAEVTLLNDTPNGVNINRDCGSTHIDRLCDYISGGGFDAGIAFDGDADRCIAVDETGELIDGDRMMAIFGLDMKNRGILKKDTLVATVMSNMGLFKFGEQNGITVEKTKVGDRYVLELMRRRGFNLGGEQSGHMVFLDHMPTGDGQLSAIQLLQIVKKSGQKLSELKTVMEVYPQAMRNIHADHVMKNKLQTDPAVEKMIRETERELDGDGRILVRASGTEPLIRVMLEGRDKQQIDELLNTLVERLEERLSDNEDCKRMAGI
jgi:phosphoglucosamine mutase